MQGITPFLWFDSNAEEAVNFYVSTFKNSKIDSVMRNIEAAPGPAGAILTIGFSLNGQQFVALNGGPFATFNQAISFMVHCETQEEVDEYWEKLTSGGGEEDQCGWLKDKFGVSWQITPNILLEYLRDQDVEKANRVMLAMLQMKKIDIAAIQRAYDGR